MTTPMDNSAINGDEAAAVEPASNQSLPPEVDVIAPTAVGIAGDELGFDAEDADATLPGVLMGDLSDGEGTVPIDASSAQLEAARAALDALLDADDDGANERDDSAEGSAIRADPALQISPAIAALMAQTRRPSPTGDHPSADTSTVAETPAPRRLSAARTSSGMMSLDGELAAAMAEAAAAVSAPSHGRASAGKTSATTEPEQQRAVEGQGGGDSGVDFDLLGALDAAIAGPDGAIDSVASRTTSRESSTVKPTSGPVSLAQSAKNGHSADDHSADDHSRDDHSREDADAPHDAASVDTPATTEDAASLFEDSLFEASPTAKPAIGEGNSAIQREPIRPKGLSLRQRADHAETNAAGTPQAGADAQIDADADADDGTSVAESPDPDHGGTSLTEAQQRAERNTALLVGLAAWMRLVKICAAPRADRVLALTAAQTTLGLLHSPGLKWQAELRGHAWFVNDDWLPVTARHGARLGELVAALRRAKRGGMWVTAEATPEQLLAATQLFVKEVRGRGEASGRELATVGFLKRPTLRPSAESWAAGVTQRCVAFAVHAMDSPRFPEADAVLLLDELCQAVPSHTGAVLRAIELRGANWTTPWGAASTVTLTLATLNHVGASPRVTRAAALTVWALTLAVRRGETPPALALLAERASVRMSALTTARPWSPVAASTRGLLRRLGQTEAAGNGPSGGDGDDGVARFIRLIYAVHRSRLSGAADLMSALLAHSNPAATPTWAAAVLAAVGPLPIGTTVQLADGRKGVVVDLPAKAGPMRPLVQVGTAMVRPSEDVQPLKHV